MATIQVCALTALLICLAASLATKPPVTVPLTGNIMPRALYLLNVYLGTGPQDQNQVAFDTGSPDILTYNTTCNGCPPQTNFTRFNPQKSSSWESCGKRDCSITLSYETCVFDHPSQPCTASGITGTDLVTFSLDPSVDPIRFDIDVISSIRPPQDTQFQEADGIWGATGPFFTPYAKANNWNTTYSWCFQQEGGWLVLGGQNQSLYTGEIFMGPTNGMMRMGITLNGQQVGTTLDYIMDTGTNTTLLPPTLYNALETSLLAACSNSSLVGLCGIPRQQNLFAGQCFSMTAAQISMFPTLQLSFLAADKSTFTLPYLPQYYLFEYLGRRCLAFQGTGTVSPIIGASLMSAYYNTFNSETHQFGFAVATPLCTGNPL